MDTFKNTPSPQDMDATKLGEGLGRILLSSLKNSTTALGMDDVHLSIALTSTIAYAVQRWSWCLKETGQESNAQKWFTNLLQCLSIVTKTKIQVIERSAG